MTIPTRAPALAAALGVLLASAGGCLDPGFAPGAGRELIANPSFERNGMPSLRGWEGADPAGLTVGVSNDAAPEGGRFCVRLKNQWTVPGRIAATAVPRPGIREYRLGAWGKVVRTGMTAGGSVFLIARTGGADTLLQAFSFSDTTWSYREVGQIVSSGKVDTLIVRLEGFLDQFSSGDVLFDLVSLRLADSELDTE